MLSTPECKAGKKCGNNEDGDDGVKRDDVGGAHSRYLSVFVSSSAAISMGRMVALLPLIDFNA